jgi:hypothetical protein
MNQKILELKSVIGEECSYNTSPTLRAKLISVNGETCVLEVAPSPYDGQYGIDNGRVGELLSGYTSYVWNAFFF